MAAAALRGWALVASTLPASRMGADWVERALGGLEAGLHTGDVDVRSAAGEAITLLFHSAGLAAADAGGAQPCGSGAQWNGACDASGPNVQCVWESNHRFDSVADVPQSACDAGFSVPSLCLRAHRSSGRSKPPPEFKCLRSLLHIRVG